MVSARSLLMRVSAHDERRCGAGQRVRPALRRREPSEHFVVAPWAGMAEERVVEFYGQR
jgi:hypothetical protein